ncbi:hypothetical protein [Streptosporangium sp. NPDC006930]|uniref:hypothetical protein n=1 Tax=unclassified Streptosporangium TaxID=2632669 RepID=UPI003449F9FE
MEIPFALNTVSSGAQQVLDPPTITGEYDEEQQLWVGRSNEQAEICLCSNSNFSWYQCFDVFFGDWC